MKKNRGKILFLVSVLFVVSVRVLRIGKVLFGCFGVGESGWQQKESFPLFAERCYRNHYHDSSSSSSSSTTHDSSLHERSQQHFIPFASFATPWEKRVDIAFKLFPSIQPSAPTLQTLSQQIFASHRSILSLFDRHCSHFQFFPPRRKTIRILMSKQERAPIHLMNLSQISIKLQSGEK